MKKKKNKCGVYKICNTINNHIYIGGTVNLTKDGKFVKEHKSQKDAAQKLGLKKACNIGTCCRGGRKYSGGFMWKFK